jgi:hypothetical protein
MRAIFPGDYAELNAVESCGRGNGALSPPEPGFAQIDSIPHLVCNLPRWNYGATATSTVVLKVRASAVTISGPSIMAVDWILMDAAGRRILRIQ